MVTKSEKLIRKLPEKQLSKYFSREVKELRIFDEPDDDSFRNLHLASSWLFKKGYQFGSLSLAQPIAVQFGEYKLHQKWYNLTESEKHNVDGVLLSDNFRNGNVRAIIFKK